MDLDYICSLLGFSFVGIAIGWNLRSYVAEKERYKREEAKDNKTSDERSGT